MGKKSKRKSTNKPSPCYHGCLTKKNFNSGEHYKVLEAWDDSEVDINEFCETNKCVMDDLTFSCFVMAHVTDDFLKGKDDATLRLRLVLLIMIRYFYIPRNEGKDVDPESEYAKKYKKYARDVRTERGRIKFMAREIPCDCMDEKRIAAKSMDKVAICWCCKTDFPKENMLRCKCDLVQYCTKECRIEAWPTHKEYCNIYNGSSATASTSTSASVPSSFEKPSDVDTDEK